ncbi:hypothetical protein [Nissabacter sp. SGAir0207]|uniref:hypothetical protein n=1 Tax=Nissabacter sp. SGAir0207 TaxID=2126321 RepID=UPI0010CCC989|nr:hypothetical protein [Nissabacter sp. SGAir0207]QCR38904.1 hypothetical protein C1N62_22605 [Nissabacter sp. SGAir0207]
MDVKKLTNSARQYLHFVPWVMLVCTENAEAKSAEQGIALYYLGPLLWLIAIFLLISLIVTFLLWMKEEVRKEREECARRAMQTKAHKRHLRRHGHDTGKSNSAT